MSNLISKSGNLVRLGSPSFRILRMPTFPLSEKSITASRFYKSVDWESPDYGPTPFPGPYDRSAALSGVSSALSSASWQAGAVTSLSLWGQRGDYGVIKTFANASYGCLIVPTTQYFGFLATVKAEVTSIETADGAGTRTIGVVATSESTPGLYVDDSLSVTSTGWKTFTNIRLSSYLRIVFFISGNAPPTEPYTYDNGFPAVRLKIGDTVKYTITGI